MLQTNHLSHFAIVNELASWHLQAKDKLTPANHELRIVMVSSVAHFYGDIDFEDLQVISAHACQLLARALLMMLWHAIHTRIEKRQSSDLYITFLSSLSVHLL